jgi:aryl-alcohol dehydrogenase-like predicted oxidoreductase
MELRSLGSGGPALSVVGLGCNNFGWLVGVEQTHAVVHAALDAGINHFDTAESYGGGNSETFLGKALGSRRDEVVIATKFGRRPADEAYVPGALARRIAEGCETSLRRLGTDRIDLYYQHAPDLSAPADEALEALDKLVQAGKVLAVASSNAGAAQVESEARIAAERGFARFTGLQIEWSLLAREAEESVIPAARRFDVGIVPFFPLASGLLSGKYIRGQEFPAGSRLASTASRFAGSATPENFDKIEALSAYATERGHTILELAIAWLAAQEGVTSIIAGATKPEQVAANAAAASWRLSSDDVRNVGALV